MELPEFLVEFTNGNNTNTAAKTLNSEIITDFCIMENEQFMGYWSWVEDRLFKIRHSMNIEGVFRKLALFETPISPMALVKAVAGGRDISSALSDVKVAVPHYRYAFMLEKAREMASTVIDLGSTLLSALQSKDAEQLAALQNTHEQQILDLMTAVKKNELDIASTTIEALGKTKDSIDERIKRYDELLSSTAKFGSESELKLSKHERQELELLASSTAAYGLAGVTKALGEGFKAIPDTTIGTSGFGGSPQATLTTKGENIAAASKAVGELSSMTAEALDSAAEMTGKMGNYERRTADWEHRKKMAEIDLEEIEKQIAIAEMRRSIANQQLAIHQKTIQQNQETADFYRSKFSNQSLYNWMVSRLSGLYFQTYKLAYDMAKSAEKALQYELPTSNTFISFGHWDNLKKGLLAGESLMLDLNRMEKTHLEQDSRFQNIEKMI